MSNRLRMLHSREWNSWNSARQRCNNPNSESYSNYGGRGIVMCNQWKVFGQFLADMGPRPEGHTLDRIDNDKGYTPENCKWATLVQQQANKRPRADSPLDQWRRSG